jgi:dTDP-4-dehydrorhamnose reductase
VSPKQVLITGGGGQLASEFADLLAPDHEVSAPSHAELDIADAAALDEIFERVRPALVLNCAAFHNLDECERDEETSRRVNVAAVGEIARRCTAAGAVLVQISTNYVFGGDAERPYLESDPPAPASVYAITKVAGEQAALGNCDQALVVRTAGLYGLGGSRSKGGNFVERMVARAREQGALRMVADQHLTPTYTADLAPAIIDAVDAGRRGLLHLTNGGSCSWYGFTEAIMERAGLDVPLEPIETSPDGVARPRNSVLASEVEGLSPLREWPVALDDYMARAGLAA